MAEERRVGKRAGGIGRHLVATAVALTAAASAQAGVIYVDDSAPPGGNGLSWATPFTYLTDALAFAAVPANGVTEIRVGQGTYVTDRSAASPAGTGLSTATFALVSGVPIRGAYAGFGSATPDARDVVNQPTILTGDIGTPGVVDDNSYNVLRGTASTGSVTLDGLVIRDGNADDSGPGSGDIKRFGGGVHLPAGALTMIDCVVENNRSINSGGGIYTFSHVTLSGCRFAGNVTTVGIGGGASIQGAGSVATITNSEFSSNSAKGVGGALMIFAATATISGCTFDLNSATGPGGYYVSSNSGGAIWGDGATIILNGAPTTITNSFAQNGAAIALKSSTLTATGAIISQNDATTLGGGIWADTQPVSLTNCTLAGNTSGFDAGAIYHSGVLATPCLTLVGCTLDGNTAVRNAGGVYANPNCILDITGSTFVNNDSNAVIQGGGAGAISFAMGTIKTSQFIGNTASMDGGALLYFGGLGAKVSQCTFTGNSAGNAGGAVMLASGAMLVDCLFEGNHATVGGAVLLRSSDPGAGPYVHTCDIINNSATSGGGIYIEQGAGLISATRIAGNVATQRGGGVYRPGNGTTTLVSCLVSGNTAALGGGGAAGNNGGTIRWVGSTIVGNTATSNGGGLLSDVGVNEISSSILWGNSDASGVTQAAQAFGPSNWLPIDHSCVQDWTGSLGGIGNFGTDPQFVDADGADNVFGTIDDSPAVVDGSPCNDAGVTTLLPADAGDMDGDGNKTELSPLDFNGGLRLMNFVMDVGAAERQVALGPGVYVGPSGGSWFTAANWAGNAVPGPTTNVYITTAVVMGTGTASANQIQIVSGGSLTCNSGSNLTATSITVEAGGGLTLNGTSQCTATTISLLSGSTFTWNAGTVSVANGGTMTSTVGVSFGCGTANAALRLLNGATFVAPSLTMCVRGTLRGTGTIAANLTNGGTVAPGLSAGAITIDGSFTQTAGGKLEMELDSYAPTAAFDTLTVTGAATFDGLLKVTALSTASPAVVSFRIIQANSISGSFATVTQTDPPGALVAGLRQLAATVDVGVTSASPRLHVKPGSAVGGAGDGWATAFPDLQTAIVATRLAPAGQVDEVWVAEGTYVPTEVVNPLPSIPEVAATFLLPADVAFYGGFVGTETLVTQRDWVAHPTILSGDRLGNDGVVIKGFDAREDNVSRVVSFVGLPLATTLDGFVVTASYNVGASGGQVGGGLYVINSSPTIRNTTLLGNAALDGGAGLYVNGGAVTVDACSFEGNVAGLLPGESGQEFGGAIRVAAGSIAVTASSFTGNSAKSAGAVGLEQKTAGSFIGCSFDANAAFSSAATIGTNDATLVVDDCTFTGGTGIDAPSPTAAAISQFRGTLTLSNSTFTDNDSANDGAVSVREVTSASSIANCTFTSNSSLFRSGAMTIDSSNLSVTGTQFIDNSAGTHGGAIWVRGSAPGGSPVLTSCDFVGNTAGGNGGAIVLDNAGPLSVPEHLVLVDCDFTGNAASAGGAIWIATESVRIEGSTISGNSAAVGSGIVCDIGSLRGNGTTIGDAVHLSGQLRLGTLAAGTIGTWTVEGGLSFDNASNGSTPVAVFDLTSNGTTTDADGIELGRGGASIDGYLLVSATTPSLPLTVGERFTLLGGGPITGDFDAVLLPSVSGGLAFAYERSSTAVDVVVVEDDGSIAFTESTSAALSGEPMDMGPADLDGDGDRDLVVALRPASGGGPGSVVVLRNDGVISGEWQGFTVLPAVGSTGIVPRSLALEDFNGDGFIDVAVANETGSISVLLNAATTGLSFLPTQTVPVGGTLVSMVAVQASGSAAKDLVVANTFTHQLQVFENSGTGTFTLSSTVPALSTRFLRAGDLTGDGVPEVVEAGTGGGVSDLVIHSTGSSLGVGVPVAGMLDPTGLTLADVDGDGWLDVVVSSGAPVASTPEGVFGGSLGVIRNDNGTLLPPVAVPVGIDPLSAAVLDADGDGDGDFATLAALVENQTLLRIARNEIIGDTILLNQVNDIGGAGTGRVTQAFDVDGDGIDDLVVAVEAEGGVAGGAGSASVTTYVNDLEPGLFGDLNGDGSVDGADLAILLGSWGVGGPADLTGDGTVDGADLAVLLGAWGS